MLMIQEHFRPTQCGGIAGRSTTVAAHIRHSAADLAHYKGIDLAQLLVCLRSAY